MKSRRITALALLSVTNIALQFFFHWYTVTSMGSGWETDALYAGLVVPVFVLSVVSTSLTHVLVPILTTCNREEFGVSVWSYIYGVGCVFGLITFLLLLTNSFWIPLLLPGFSPEAIELTRSVFKIQVFGIIGTSIVAVLEAASHAQLKFYNVELKRILVSALGLVALSLTIGEYGVYAAATIYSLRPMVLFALLLRHAGRWRSFKPDFDKALDVWARFKYLLAGSLYYRLDPLLDRYLLSSAIPGSITLYYLAQQVYGAGNSVMSRSISAPMVPVLANHSASESWQAFRSEYRKRIVLAAILTISAVLILVIFGKPILILLFQHKNFSEESIYMMWGIMMALAGTFVAGSTGQVLASAFYAAGDTRTPTKIGVVGYSIGAVLKIWSFYSYGVLGLAVATSTYYVLNATALYFFLKYQVETRIGIQEN